MISTTDFCLNHYPTVVVDVPRTTTGGVAISSSGPPPAAESSNSTSFQIASSPIVAVPWTIESEWTAYLLRLADEPIGRALHVFWQRIRQAQGEVPPPIAIRADDGSMHLAWDHSEYHLDVDLWPDGTFEWFYRNGLTNELDGTDEGRVAGMPEAFAARLRLVSA